MNADWDCLDAAAKANLDEYGLHEFFSYKEELRTAGHKWEDAEDVLRGFIWDELEDEK